MYKPPSEFANDSDNQTHASVSTTAPGSLIKFQNKCKKYKKRVTNLENDIVKITQTVSQLNSEIAVQRKAKFEADASIELLRNENKILSAENAELTRLFYMWRDRAKNDKFARQEVDEKLAAKNELRIIL